MATDVIANELDLDLYHFFKKAAGGIRTPGLLITNQPLYH